MLATGRPVADEPIFSLLDDEGDVLAGGRAPQVNDADALRLYRGMLQVRLVDERMMKLQRQGRLGFYMLSTGEEATHFAVHALRASDWVFPSYREPGAAFHRGYSIKDYTNQLFGNAEDPVKGRQMPVHHSARWANFVSISSPVGTQIPQAVGMAMAARIAKKDDVAVTYFGEGTSSTGEFHVGMNFAAVFKAPCIFICRNNGWAISTDQARQTASRTFAVKALAYGMPGVRVDGNDLLAVLAVMEDAVARARAGEGPTLIEAVTYRRGGHSSSDDPNVYRDPNEPKEWERRDPIERWKRYLTRRGLYSEAIEARFRQEIGDELKAALDRAETLGPPPVESMFDDVFAEIPPHLEEQKRELLALPRATNPHGGH
jgi:pyruvate dehydrogenase E1 component subunit alpha